MTIKYFAAAALAALATSPLAADSDAMLAEARATAQQFGKALKGEVMRSMKAGGPVPTINMCNHRAPQIANEVSATSGWNVARTSLKLRNANNAPDSWEQAVLESFEQRKANGEPMKTLEYSEVVEQGDVKMFRYMKAIPTGKPCLHCHAAEIKPQVADTLKPLYPNDQARGFKVGDIRGAFTLSKPM